MASLILQKLKVLDKQREQLLAGVKDEALKKAQAAIDGEDWVTAIEKLQAVLDLQVDYRDAVALLKKAKRRGLSG